MCSERALPLEAVSVVTVTAVTRHQTGTGVTGGSCRAQAISVNCERLLPGHVSP